MDRNLGARSNNPADVALTYGLKYQWGRKDPFYGGAKNETVAFSQAEGNVIFNDACDMKWYGLILTVLVKGTAAGYAAGLVYRLLCRKSEKAAVLVAGIVCPVVNTGLFFAGMALFFMDTLSGMAANAGQSVIVYMVLGLAGINFVVELLVNIALSSGITHIIKSRKRGRA